MINIYIKNICQGLVNRFNSLVYVKHFDSQNSNKRKKKRKNVQFTTIRNPWNIAN